MRTTFWVEMLSMARNNILRYGCDSQAAMVSVEGFVKGFMTSWRGVRSFTEATRMGESSFCLMDNHRRRLDYVETRAIDASLFKCEYGNDIADVTRPSSSMSFQFQCKEWRQSFDMEALKVWCINRTCNRQFIVNQLQSGLKINYFERFKDLRLAEQVLMFQMFSSQRRVTRNCF